MINKYKKIIGMSFLSSVLAISTSYCIQPNQKLQTSNYASKVKLFKDNKITNELLSNLQHSFTLQIRDYINSWNLSKEDVNKIKNDIDECIEFYNKSMQLRESHFGYPANMSQRSPLVDAFRFIEAYGYLANNCGDVNETGNYQMDSKKIERDILKIFAEKFGIEDKYWGYITSGGSESNQWAINTSFKKNPNGILYFCESAHYSIYKNSESLERRIIPQVSDTDESIDCSALFEEIEKNYNENKSPANIILTWGTTKYGSCDNIKKITDFLISKGIPYYVHVDAALFGGIPNNQLDAPIISNIKELNIDSISVSLHKYLGVPTVKSVLLSTGGTSFGNHVDYIGQTDSTTSGSRDIMPFSTRQQVIDVLHHSDPEDYRKNINFFIECLESKNVNYIRDGKSNTFVIDAPSEEICKKYQLSCFKDKLGNNKAHIIIFPYQNQESIKNLVNDIK